MPRAQTPLLARRFEVSNELNDSKLTARFLLTRNQALRIATNIAKLPDLPRKHTPIDYAFRE
jgi:hypothetical protein